jgi:hypothetical protein
MEQTQDRVTGSHAGPRVAHHIVHRLAHLAAIAVDGAIGAGRLLCPKRAVPQTSASITKQLSALGAKTVGAPVVIAAEELDHDLHGLQLAFQAWMLECHFALSLAGRVQTFPPSCPFVRISSAI